MLRVDPEEQFMGTELAEFAGISTHELLFRVDAEQSVDDEVYAPVSTEV